MGISFFLFALLVNPLSGSEPLPLGSVRLPKGFKIELYARVPGARSLTQSPSGIVYVGTRQHGKVYAVLPKSAASPEANVVVIADGLNQPNGVAYRKSSLYVAEVSRILRYDRIDEGLSKRSPAAPAIKPVVVTDDYPAEKGHDWRYIGFSPDDWLYVAVGAPCNVCVRKDPIYASITRIKPDGSGRIIFAHGVRNSVGFDWEPGSNTLWFTDNGRDLLGDNIPPDELNKTPEPGVHFGFPYCHGSGIQDPQFDKRPCREFVTPELDLGPHVAALGMRFYTGSLFPEKYRNGIFIAEHGSWNRSDPIGYRITHVPVKNGKATGYETFAQGWLDKGDVWGRPVDVLVMKDGSLLVSDDYAGVLYRISYLSSR